MTMTLAQAQAQAPAPAGTGKRRAAGRIRPDRIGAILEQFKRVSASRKGSPSLPEIR